MNNQIMIGNFSVKQTDDGLFCLNDLHKASGGERKHEIANFKILSTTVDMVNLLESENTGFPVLRTELGRNGGTYVCKEIVYAYAMWISPKFMLKVIRAFDAIAQGNIPQAPQTAGMVTIPADSYTAMVRMIESAFNAQQDKPVKPEQKKLAKRGPKPTRCQDDLNDMFTASQIADLISDKVDCYPSDVNKAMSDLGYCKRNPVYGNYDAIHEFKKFSRNIGNSTRWSKEFVEKHKEAIANKLRSDYNYGSLI